MQTDEAEIIRSQANIAPVGREHERSGGRTAHQPEVVLRVLIEVFGIDGISTDGRRTGKGRKMFVPPLPNDGRIRRLDRMTLGAVFFSFAGGRPAMRSDLHSSCLVVAHSRSFSIGALMPNSRERRRRSASCWSICGIRVVPEGCGGVSARSPRRRGLALAADALARPGTRKWRAAHQATPHLGIAGSRGVRSLLVVVAHVRSRKSEQAVEGC